MTKKEAVAQHRRMWRWIAGQYKDGRKIHVYDLKVEYCKSNGFEYLRDFCFCCEIARKKTPIDNYCICCPLIWGTEDLAESYFCEKHTDIPKPSPYWNLHNLSDDEEFDTNKAYELALQIANLPEKEGEQ